MNMNTELPVKRRADIIQGFEDLEEELTKCEELVNRVIEKLEPILSSNPESNSELLQKAMSTPLGLRLARNTSTIRTIKLRLDELLENIEL